MGTAAWIQALCMAVLVGVTIYYACQTKRMASRMKQQLDLAKTALDEERDERKRQDRERQKRAVAAIGLELALNEASRRGSPAEDAPMLLDAHYDANAWALNSYGAREDTQRTVAMAYQAIRRYNLALRAVLHADRMDVGQRSTRAKDARKHADKAMTEALRHFGEDPATADLVPQWRASAATDSSAQG